jgi:hypothetical protein
MQTPVSRDRGIAGDGVGDRKAYEGRNDKGGAAAGRLGDKNDCSKRCFLGGGDE